MCDPLPLGGKKVLRNKFGSRSAKLVKNNRVIFISITFITFGLMFRLWDAQPVFYAHAYTGDDGLTEKIQSPLLDNQIELFAKKDNQNQSIIKTDVNVKNKYQEEEPLKQSDFADRIYALVGDAPIKEMVPFISKRDEKVAAFLVGIAKKESSFGSASPSKDGEDCYNYWGYKGSGGNGSAMGYACFGSAEEAVETVGNRIEVLVNKDRNTPARMVNTWKCGVSCAGDPGAPGWISTVASYFNKIVS